MKTTLKSYSRPTLLALPLVTVALFSFLLSRAEAVKPPPVGVTITQATGNLSNHKLIITGTNFSAPVVNLDNTNLTVTSSTATTINATLPAMITEGSYHLRVTTNTGIANLDLALENGDLGNNNTYEGAGALASLTTGTNNTAVGSNALFSNDTGQINDAVGSSALFSNVDGEFNNAMGDSALFSNIHASNNTAIGDLALANNDSTGNNLGNVNTAVGAQALRDNTDGGLNNAVGFQALTANTTGNFNAAFGFQALASNVDGSSNVALGGWALSGNVDGIANVAVGGSAFSGNAHGTFNTVVGFRAGADLTNGGDNIYIGATAAGGVTSESETIRIGDPNFVAACFIAGITGQTASGGAAVFIDGNGKLGTLTSSAQFKDNIKPMDKASESILALKPVTFRYKKAVDANRIPQFGLVAEDVVKVNPDLVINGRDGKPYTVRYEAVNAMLLNEFLKEHRTVQELKSVVAKQETTIAQQQKGMEVLAAGLKEQASQIAKVSAQIEANTRAPQIAVNNQ